MSAGRASRRFPEIERLIEQDRYLEAFTLANQADAYVHDDPKLAALWPAISVVGSWDTTPAGAEILFKEYAAPDAAWHKLGVTPLHDTRLPRGALRFLIQKDGFEPLHLARAVTPPFAPESDCAAAGRTLKDMVAVPGETLPVNLSGFNTESVVKVGPFRIDRTEVTNRAYKEFVDAAATSNRATGRRRRGPVRAGRQHRAARARRPGSLANFPRAAATTRSAA